jgi:hypothetical protein
MLNKVILFAETIPLTVPTFSEQHNSGGATDPQAWSHLAGQLGPFMFFAVVCLVAFILLVFGIGWALFKFGGKLMDRLEVYLDGQQSINTSNAVLCKDTNTSVIGIREAQHGFASLTGEIAKEMGLKNVDEKVDRIHDRLRTIYVQQ